MTAPRILVMEDNMDLLRLYSKALRRDSYEVFLAATGQQARNLLAECDFEVLLCDIHMGDGLGTDLLREHLDQFRRQGTVIVVISAQAQYRPMCEELGVEFYLEKPIAIDAFLNLVARLTARVRA